MYLLSLCLFLALLIALQVWAITVGLLELASCDSCFGVVAMLILVFLFILCMWCCFYFAVGLFGLVLLVLLGVWCGYFVILCG